MTGELAPDRAEQLFWAALPEIDNPRFRQLVRQFEADAFGAIGDVERGGRVLDELIAHGLIDRDWLERCPALASLRETPSYLRALETTQQLTRQMLRVELAASTSIS